MVEVKVFLRILGCIILSLLMAACIKQMTPGTQLTPQLVLTQVQNTEDVDGHSPATPLPDSDLTPSTCLLIDDYLQTEAVAQQPQGVSASPNATLLEGVVLCVTSIQSRELDIKPDMPLYLVEVQIIKTSEIENFTDRLSGLEGETILVISKQSIPPSALGHTVEGIVKYRGDERGGSFWVVDQILIR